MYLLYTGGDTSGSDVLIGLDEWQGAIILVVAFLLVVGFCIAFGVVRKYNY